MDDLQFQNDQESGGKFLKIGFDELAVFIQLIANNMLQHRDVTVFLAFISLTDWRTGRCRASSKKVASVLGKTQSYVSLSLKRLKYYKLMVPFIDETTGEKFHIINPHFLMCGSGRRRGFLIKCYQNAIHDNEPFMEDHS